MSIQKRLLIFFLIVVLIPMADTALLTARVLTTTLESKARQALEVDLKLAWSVVRQRMDALRRGTQQAALGLTGAVISQKQFTERARSALLQLKKTQRTSFAVLLDPQRRILCRANSFASGDTYPPLTILESAWKNKPNSGLELIPAKLVEVEGLEQEAKVPLETPTEFFRDALALVTAVPVTDGSGRVVAVLLAGELLNNNTVIPDLVSEPTGHILSIWLRDTCIATNARRKDGSRAVGASLRLITYAPGASEGYQEMVLAGEPQKAIRSHIRNSANEILGTLQVGIPLRDLEEPRRRALLVIILASVGGSAIAILLAAYLARRISRPLKEMVEVTRQVAEGDLSVEVPVAGKDEVSELAQSFNQMIRDLSQAQEQLVRSHRLAAIGQLAGSVSHELRNPLSVLRSSAYYLRTRLSDADAKVTKHLNIIEQEVANSDKIITDLLDFSRTKPPTLQQTYLNYVIEDTLTRVEVPQAVTVKLELADGLPPLWADTFQLEQVLVNLVSNAIQAMPQGGALTVRTDRLDDTFRTTVSDTGTGIRPDDLEHIFEPLFTTKARGIGLGLAVCKTLIENHGGSITVESVVGKGTTFTVNLPLGARPAGADRDQAEEESPKGM